MNLNSLSTISIYILSSVFATILNKYIVSSSSKLLPITLILIQSIGVSLFLILILLFKNAKIFSIKKVNLRQTNAHKWIFSSFLLTAMIHSGIKALQHLPVSIFTLFKNLTTIFVAILEYKFFDKKITKISIISFVLIFLSSLFVDIADFQTSLFGYIYMSINVVSTAFYVLFLRKTILEAGVTNLEAVFYAQFNSIPFLVVLLLFLKEYKYFNLIDSKFIYLSSLSCVFIFMIAYSTTITLKKMSSTCLTMMGSTNKFLISISGIIFLHEKNVNILKIISVILGTVSGAIYLLEDVFKGKT